MGDPRSTRRWRVLRAAVIERDSRCGLCYKEFVDGDRIEVDHIKEVATHPELALDPTNCRAVHRDCHIRHSKGQAVRSRRRAADPTTRTW